MKKKIIVALVLCLELIAQNSPMNHTKYWFYRYRLRNELLTLGEDACGKPSGKMIPAGFRYGDYIIGKDNDDIPIRLPSRDFGDGTSFLGT